MQESSIQFLQVGEVIKPHGVRGEVGVKSVTERPDLRFRAGEKLWLGTGEADKIDERSLEQVTVLSARAHKQGYLVFFNSIADRNAADKVRGWKLFIPADQAAELDPGRFYYHQLVGLTVIDEQGIVIGQVCSVVDSPGQNLLEIERPAKGPGKVLVPLVEEIVRKIDTGAGVLVVRLPQGLLDI